MNLISLRFGHGARGVAYHPEIAKAPGHLYLVSGPSGVGKGSIIRGMFSDPAAYQFVVQVPSVKTRPPRPGETAGSHADTSFITLDEFEGLRRDNKLLLWQQFDGHWYTATLQSVLKPLRTGLNVLIELSADAALKLKALYPAKITTIFIPPPNQDKTVLHERMQQRGANSPESIEARLKQADADMALIPRFDIVIENQTGKLQYAIQQLRSLLTKSASA